MDVKRATGDMTNVKQASEQTNERNKKSGGPALSPDHLFPLLLLGVCNGASHKPTIKNVSENPL
jgi:hypothetical protein